MQNWTLQWKIIAAVSLLCIVASGGIIFSMSRDIVEVVSVLYGQQVQTSEQVGKIN